MTRRRKKLGRVQTFLGFEPGKPVWATLLELVVGLTFIFGGPLVTVVAMARFPLLREADGVRLIIGITVACAVVTGLTMRACRGYFFSFITFSARSLREWTTWLVLIPYVIGVCLALIGWVWGGLIWWNGSADHAAPQLVRAVVLQKRYLPGGPQAVPAYWLTLGSAQLGRRPLHLSIDGTRFHAALFEAASQGQVGKEIELFISPGALAVPWIRDLRPSRQDNKEVGGREGG